MFNESFTIFAYRQKIWKNWLKMFKERCMKDTSFTENDNTLLGFESGAMFDEISRKTYIISLTS